MLQIPKQIIFFFHVFGGPDAKIRDTDAKKRTPMLKNSTNAKIQGCRGVGSLLLLRTQMLKKGDPNAKKDHVALFTLTELRQNRDSISFMTEG